VIVVEVLSAVFVVALHFSVFWYPELLKLPEGYHLILIDYSCFSKLSTVF